MSLTELSYQSKQDRPFQSERPHPGKFPTTTQISERKKPLPAEKPTVIDDPVRLPRETAGQGIQDTLILENAEGTYIVPLLETPNSTHIEVNNIDHAVAKVTEVMQFFGKYEIASHIKNQIEKRTPFVPLGVRPLEIGQEVVIPQS